ncbi:hypothetical protein ACFPFV_03415 [Salinicoccus siamensis]
MKKPTFKFIRYISLFSIYFTAYHGKKRFSVHKYERYLKYIGPFRKSVE